MTVPKAARSAILLAALTAIVFGRLVAHPSYLLADPDRPNLDRAVPPGAVTPGNDATRLFIPHHLRVAAALNRTGHVPGWDGFGFGGRPLVGNPQAGLWYPPTWIAWASGSPAAPGWLTVGHLFFGAMGMLAASRAMRVGWFAATVAGSTWLSSPYVLGQICEGHYPHLWSASWVPWTVFAAIRPGMRWLIPPCLALGFLTGHPQETYYLSIALGFWLLFECGARIRRGRLPGSIAALAFGAIIILTVAGMIAIELLPDARVQPYALRGAKLSMRDAGKYHVNNINLVQLLSPRALGGPAGYFGPGSYWEPLLAIGWIPLILAAIAIARSERRQAVAGWTTLVLISVLFAWGPRLGVFRLVFALVPGMGQFRVPARALFLATTGAAALTGLGVEAMASRGLGLGSFRSYRLIVAMLVAALAVAVLVDPGGNPTTDRQIWTHAAARVALDPTFLAALIATTTCLAWLRRRPGDRRRVALAMGVLAMGELAYHGFDVIRVSPPARFLGPDAVGHAIARVMPDEPARIRARDAFFGDLRAVALGLEKTNANDSFQVQHAADLYETLYPMFGDAPPPRLAARSRAEVQRGVLDRMNVALLVSDRDDPRIGWPIAASGDRDGVPFVIRKNPHLLPRAYVVPRAQVAADTAAIVEQFAQDSPREAVFLPSDPLTGLGPRQPFTPALYSSIDPDRVEIRVKTEAPGLLVVADTWMPGWSAEVDGREVAILRGNRAQRVVPLREPGSHRITMRYTPPGLAAGQAITSATFALWAVAWAANRFRKHGRGMGI